VRLSLERRVKETEGRMAEMAASLEKKGTELAVLRQELEEERDERLKLEEDLEVGGARLWSCVFKWVESLFVCKRAVFSNGLKVCLFAKGLSFFKRRFKWEGGERLKLEEDREGDREGCFLSCEGHGSLQIVASAFVKFERTGPDPSAPCDLELNCLCVSGG
jgi:hypothetical protein